MDSSVFYHIFINLITKSMFIKICQTYIIHEMFKIEEETSPERFVKLEKRKRFSLVKYKKT